MTFLGNQQFFFGSALGQQKAEAAQRKRLSTGLRVEYLDAGGALPGWYWQANGSPVGPFPSASAARRDASPETEDHVGGTSQ